MLKERLIVIMHYIVICLLLLSVNTIRVNAADLTTMSDDELYEKVYELEEEICCMEPQEVVDESRIAEIQEAQKPLLEELNIIYAELDKRGLPRVQLEYDINELEKLAKAINEQNALMKTPTGQYNETIAREVVDYALSWMDKEVEFSNARRTQIGTSDPYNSATDCSYFTYEVYNKLGYEIGLTAEAQRNDGVLVGEGKSALKDAKPGDLICYTSRWTSSGHYWGHVGVYIGNGLVVHVGSFAEGVHVSKADYREIHSIRRIV